MLRRSGLVRAPDTERVHLAAAFRWMARFGFHEGVANHSSVCADGKSMLVNPGSRHFSKLRASDMVAIDVDASASTAAEKGIDPTAFALHSVLHRRFGEKARCLVHAHPVNATALSALKDKTLPAIDQNCARFFNRVKVDHEFLGMAMEDEPDRLASAISPLGNERVILMGNHGVTTLGPSIGDALDTLYYFERACAIYMTAKSTGMELSVMSDEVAEKTAQQWENEFGGCGQQHFAELLRILDEEEPQYKM
jgi:ribulose-5-phosphate 4-epimerase/fuculose-1-phosphate aldolase